MGLPYKPHISIVNNHRHVLNCRCDRNYSFIVILDITENCKKWIQCNYNYNPNTDIMSKKIFYVVTTIAVVDYNLKP